jgi:hypothetical protein
MRHARGGGALPGSIPALAFGMALAATLGPLVEPCGLRRPLRGGSSGCAQCVRVLLLMI